MSLKEHHPSGPISSEISAGFTGGPDDPDKFNDMKGENPHKRRRAMVIIGSVAATAVAAGALYLGINGEKNNTEPRVEAIPTAPVTPGENPSAAVSPSIGEKPSADVERKMAGVPLDQIDPARIAEYKAKTEYTTNNFWYVIDGKVYEGIQAATKAVEVRVTDPEDAFPQIVDRLNDWVNSANTPQEKDWYDDYVSEDEYYGAAGTRDFYNNLYMSTLKGNEEGKSSSGFLQKQTEALDNNLTYKGVSEADHKSHKYPEPPKGYRPFRAQYTADTKPFVTSSDEAAGLVAIAVNEVTYSDNGNRNSIGDRRSEPDGYLGIDTPVFSSTAHWLVHLANEEGKWGISWIQIDEKSK